MNFWVSASYLSWLAPQTRTHLAKANAQISETTHHVRQCPNLLLSFFAGRRCSMCQTIQLTTINKAQSTYIDSCTQTLRRLGHRRGQCPSRPSLCLLWFASSPPPFLQNYWFFKMETFAYCLHLLDLLESAFPQSNLHQMT